jgi:hypothetical protein
MHVNILCGQNAEYFFNIRAGGIYSNGMRTFSNSKLFHHKCMNRSCPVSVVTIAWASQPEDSCYVLGGGGDFLPNTVSKPAVGSTLPPFKYVPAFFPEGKRPGREGNYISLIESIRKCGYTLLLPSRGDY